MSFDKFKFQNQKGPSLKTRTPPPKAVGRDNDGVIDATLLVNDSSDDEDDDEEDIGADEDMSLVNDEGDEEDDAEENLEDQMDMNIQRL